jgi:hypothetical protein
MPKYFATVTTGQCDDAGRHTDDPTSTSCLQEKWDLWEQRLELGLAGTTVRILTIGPGETIRGGVRGEPKALLKETTMPTQLTSPTRRGFALFSVVGAILWTFAVLAPAGAERSGTDDTAVYSYTLAHEATTASYDESMVVACLQGIVNRDCPRVYVLSRKDNRPEYWRKILSGKGRWLEGKTFEPLADLAALVEQRAPRHENLRCQ